MPPLIEAHDLSKHYGSTIALDAVNFEVHEGVTGLLGPNGAGKSTAIKLFLGLIRPTSGSAEVLGKRPYDSVESRSRLGYMPETETVPSNMNASEFLMHMAQLSGLPPAHARTRAADILRHVGLDEERYRLIGEYSTGMKQRVKLAQSLVHDPVLVLLDEPTAGLDPAGREEMLELIRRTAHSFGISMLLSTHLMGDIERTADRVILLEDGRVSEEGALSEFTQETEDLLIEVDDREGVARALSGRGVRVIEEPQQLVVQNATDADYDAIRDAVADVGARLRRLTPRRHTLTEMFRRREE
ncbi:MAG: ABC transporter ATP-binding protein [Chloroflexi bacterium]|nr:ABC transporter ATP-binding protein [Chloroflexota bacterium]